jgi:hypothetical protein
MSKDNMALWNSVCETDPQFTKVVNQRGGFTAIGAQSQLMKATEIFGAFGTGWGVNNERIEKWEDVGLALYQADLWFNHEAITMSKGTKVFPLIPIHSSIRYQVNGRIDDDFFKKVATDALTKGLSKLGFNADVFMGKFDDNKYVNSLKEKFSKEETKEEQKSVEKTVKEALTGIPEADDFYVKVLHALEKGAIGNGNLESSLEKITEYKSNLQLEIAMEPTKDATGKS